MTDVPRFVKLPVIKRQAEKERITKDREKSKPLLVHRKGVKTQLLLMLIESAFAIISEIAQLPIEALMLIGLALFFNLAFTK